MLTCLICHIKENGAQETFYSDGLKTTIKFHRSLLFSFFPLPMKTKVSLSQCRSSTDTLNAGNANKTETQALNLGIIFHRSTAGRLFFFLLHLHFCSSVKALPISFVLHLLSFPRLNTGLFVAAVLQQSGLDCLLDSHCLFKRVTGRLGCDATQKNNGINSISAHISLCGPWVLRFSFPRGFCYT